MLLNLSPDNEKTNCPQCNSKNIEITIQQTKTRITKIILVLVICASIILVACGSTTHLSTRIAWTLMGIGIGLVVIAIGISIYIFIKEGKTYRKVICKDCGKNWKLPMQK